MSKVDEAVKLFNQGFNCAQAVFSAYCEELGLEKNAALKTASGFGAGMGRLQEVCGAVTGASMVLSLKYGSAKENDVASKEKLYGLIQEFNKRFKERNKTVNCKDLLGIDLIKGDKIENSARVKAVCPKMVKDAAEILEELIEKTSLPKVGFICVHNSCRSQMAEALGKHFAKDVFESYSGGTEIKPQINEDAVSVIKELYDMNMSAQKSKLISELPKLDIVITMGCNVNCPHLPCKHREDWGLDDPTGKGKEEFIKTVQLIENKILDLKNRIQKKLL